MVALASFALLICSSAFSQTTEEGSRFNTVAAQARSLSAALGKPVRVEGSLGRLPILVLSRNGSPEQVLRLMASALNASVVDDGVSLLIRRLAPDRKAIAERRLIRVKNWLDARWVQWTQTVAKFAQTGPLDAQYQAASKETSRIIASNQGRSYFDYVEPINTSEFEPAGRLLRKIVERIGLRELADLPLDGWVFYSDTPNAFERQLPNIGKDLSVFAEEQEKLAGLLPVDGTVVSVPSELKVLVRIIRTTDYLAFGIGAYSSTGRLVAMSGDMSRLSMLWGAPWVEGAKYFSKRDARWKSLDEASKPFVDTANFRSAGMTLDSDREKAEPWIDLSRRRLRTNLMPSIFFKPDRFEPNDYVVREGLMGIADGYPDKPFVAVVPDALWADSFGAVKNYRVNVGAFLHFVEKDGAEVVSTNEGTVVRLNDPDAQEQYFADRTILGASVRSFANSNFIGVRQWCRTLAELCPLGKSSVGGWYLGKVLESVPSFQGKTVYDPTFQRFIGTMSDLEWEQACRLGSVTLSSPESMEAFRQLISHEGAPVTGGDAGGPSTLDRPVENLTVAEADRVSVRLKLDQSVALRVTAGGKAAFGTSNSPLSSPRNFGKLLKTRLFHPTQGVDTTKALEEFLSTLRFKYFRQARYSFTIPFSTGRALAASFLQDEDAEAQEVGFDELPQSIRDEIVAGYSETSIPSRSNGDHGGR